MKIGFITYSEELVQRMHQLVSLLSITNPNHTNEITMIKMEAESIMDKLRSMN